MNETEETVVVCTGAIISIMVVLFGLSLSYIHDEVNVNEHVIVKPLYIHINTPPTYIPVDYTQDRKIHIMACVYAQGETSGIFKLPMNTTAVWNCWK